MEIGSGIETESTHLHKSSLVQSDKSDAKETPTKEVKIINNILIFMTKLYYKEYGHLMKIKSCLDKSLQLTFKSYMSLK